MKKNITILIGVIYILSSGISITLADEHHHHSNDHHSHAHDGEHPHEHNHSIEKANPTETLKLINIEVTELAKAINTKNSAEIHDRSEKLSNLASTLSNNITGEDSKRTIGLVNNLKRAADDLHTNVDKKNYNTSNDSLKKIESLLTLINSKIK
jgi:hypothetical protein